MKKKILYALMIIPLCIAIVCLFFLPDKIPMHYGADGIVNRYGSKFESLIFPFIIITFGIFSLFIIKHVTKHEDSEQKNNVNVTTYSMIGTMLLFNALFLYFQYTSFTNAQNLYDTDFPMQRVILPLLGIFLIVIGNVVPKVKMNSFIGLRTKSSMKNEFVWKKSQKFSGRIMILAGLILIIFSLFFTSLMNAMYFMIIVILIEALISVIYAYLIAKKDDH